MTSDSTAQAAAQSTAQAAAQAGRASRGSSQTDAEGGPHQPAHRWDVDESQEGARLDVFLTDKLNLTRSQWRSAIDAGHVLVDGKPAAKAGSRLRFEQDVAVTRVPYPPPLDAIAEAIPLDVVFEDSHLLVVNKPAGMVVHPSAGHPTGTLVNAVLHHVGELPAPHDPLRPGIVHRLDKDTSGLMVVAKTNQALQSLSAQLKNRVAKRSYLAVILGRRIADQGTFDTPYGRHPTHRLRFTSRAGDRNAVTHWSVLCRSDATSLVAAQLGTGRTHQIRVHFSEHGYPVAGDTTYGGQRDARNRSHPELRAVAKLPRHALHATGLAFQHPETGQILRFIAPWEGELSLFAQSLYPDGAEQEIQQSLASWLGSAEEGW